MRSSIVSTALLLGLAAVTGGQELAKLRPAANLVRLDVYPVAADGTAITDLAREDLEVREDNVPQEIATFERVMVGPPAPLAAVAPSRPLAAGERVRILVVFLDTYHTEPRAARAVYQPLVRLLDEAMGAGDMVAVMTPDMTARDLVFSRRAPGVGRALSRFEQFAAGNSVRERDAEEERYDACFPEGGNRRRCVDPRSGREVVDSNAYEGVAREMVGRRREHRVMTAMTELTRMLERLNDARKAVLVVSSGWQLYRESPRLMRLSRCEPVAAERTPDAVDATICEADRRRLAQLDIHAEFRRLMDGANRANVSFYPIDTGASGAGPHVDAQRALAENTDGLPIDAGDLGGGIRRVMADLTSYYLIGYYSTNTKVDGTYRRVTVSVNRRGVGVRARRGYRAISAGELERERTASALAGQTLGGPLAAVQAAVAGLNQITPSSPSRTRVAYGPSGDGRLRVWAVAELAVETARDGAWLGGGAVDAALTAPDNSALLSGEAAIPAGQRSVVLDLGELNPPDVTTSLRLRLRPSGEGPVLAEDVPLSPLTGGAGVPLLFRRGPTTGTRHVPTADPRFRRTERVRLELPRAARPGSLKAGLLDRTGAPLPVAVTTSTRDDNGVVWATVDLTLAPLAHGDYVIRLEVDGEESVTAIRVVP